MADNTTYISTLLEQAETYSKTAIELLKLKAIKISAAAVSSLVSSLVIILTVVLSLLIVNIGLALWIGKLLGDYYYGFFVMGGFYAILAILLYIFRKQLLKYPVSNSIIKQMLKK